MSATAAVSSVISSKLSSENRSGKELEQGQKFHCVVSSRLFFTIIQRLLFVVVPSCHVHRAEAAIVVDVLMLSPNHMMHPSYCFHYSCGPQAEGFGATSYTLWELMAYLDPVISSQGKPGLLF